MEHVAKVAVRDVGGRGRPPPDERDSVPELGLGQSAFGEQHSPAEAEGEGEGSRVRAFPCVFDLQKSASRGEGGRSLKPLFGRERRIGGLRADPMESHVSLIRGGTYNQYHGSLTDHRISSRLLRPRSVGGRGSGGRRACSPYPRPASRRGRR